MSIFPDTFKVKTAKIDNNRMPLVHRHVTTTDFFRVQPVLCREIVPNDRMNIDVTSFVRFFPMPVPTFGRVRYYNRVFFVPFQQIMEGYKEFDDDTVYYHGSDVYKISRVPSATNAVIAETFVLNGDLYPQVLSEELSDEFFWRSSSRNGTNVDVLVDYTGKVAVWYDGTSQMFFYRDSNTDIHFVNAAGFSQDELSVNGVYALDTSTAYDVYSLYRGLEVDPDNLIQRFSIPEGSFHRIGKFDDDLSPMSISSTPFEGFRYDFIYNSTPRRFTAVGKRFYTLLCSLGYRVNFISSGTDFTNTKVVPLTKLLAYVKVFLDWYQPSAYVDDPLYGLFTGTSNTGKTITSVQLYQIATKCCFCTYDRDYFTSAWQRPDAPNGDVSGIDISDSTVHNFNTRDVTFKSLVTTGLKGQNLGSNNNTPTILGASYDSSGSVTSYSENPRNVSQFILDSLKALTNYIRRFQLSGNRAVDRHLAQYGVNLSDDQANRSYYIGGYSYDAEISDVMSNSDTEFASLGDYAGKGVAYSDAHRSFHFEAGPEAGFIIILSSVVPNAGYVQGIMRENLHLTRMDFHKGDFDNLGTQAIRRDELFGDSGLLRLDGKGVASSQYADDSIFGFAPRYSEYKIGYDLLTGDFNVPHAREGIDAYHLFRLFPDMNIPSINKSFLIGDQAQYDRIFQNTSDEYDHMYVVHRVDILADRPMKSISDVYQFDDAPGREIEIGANGSQFN